MGLLDSIKNAFSGNSSEESQSSAAASAAIQATLSSIDAAQYKTIVFQHGAVNGQITILSAVPGNVTFQYNNQNFVLSDAGESYFLVNGKAAKFAEANAAPANVAFALSAGTTNLITPTQVKSAGLAAAASQTLFGGK